jgi:hypothetical protein
MIGMTPDAAAKNPEMASETRQALLDEIGAKWSKFSEQELSTLTGNYDLVNKVVAKYHIEKIQAQREVDALLKGRYI